MDWGTHVVLASKILGACGLEKGAAIYSNLPAIDSSPPEYHRVYAHILENQPDILDAALEIFGSKAIAERDFQKIAEIVKPKVAQFEEKRKKAVTPAEKNLWKGKIYTYSRILEEAPFFIELADKAKSLLNVEEIGNISQHKLSAGVSLITHIFFDTFNNPVQAFLPYSSLASAQWDFWDQIDYLRFRQEFYEEKSIKVFCREIADCNIWGTKLKPEALIKAMIIRVGEQGRPAIPYEAIDWAIRKFLRYMDINEYQRVDNEIKFLRLLEQKIIEAVKTRFPKEIEE